MSYKNRRNQNLWSRESIEMVHSYRDARGVVVVEHWKYGEVGRLDQELTACVVL
jgi:hemolysin activation/secretion protein